MTQKGTTFSLTLAAERKASIMQSRHETTISALACSLNRTMLMMPVVIISSPQNITDIIMIAHTALLRRHRQTHREREALGYVSHQNAKHKCYPRSQPQPGNVLAVKPCGLVRLHFLAEILRFVARFAKCHLALLLSSLR